MTCSRRYALSLPADVCVLSVTQSAVDGVRPGPGDGETEHEDPDVHGPTTRCRDVANQRQEEHASHAENHVPSEHDEENDRQLDAVMHVVTLKPPITSAISLVAFVPRVRHASILESLFGCTALIRRPTSDGPAISQPGGTVGIRRSRWGSRPRLAERYGLSVRPGRGVRRV